MAFKPQCKLGENTQACTDDLKLCIQVTGYGQDQELQKMYFYQEDLKSPTQEKADEVVTQVESPINFEGGTTADCPSTLFNWDKNKVAGLKLGLQIKKAKGGYIHLPVANHITANTQNDKDNQYKSNHFLAFIPLAVSDLDRTYADYLTKPYIQPNESDYRFYSAMPEAASDVVYAPAREGYLYLFFNKKLWRELKIEQDSAGKNTYQDTDINAYRTEQGTGIFQTEETLKGQPKSKLIREAEGEKLDNIWLPFRLSDKETKIKITYSEDQLSPERLNLIEAKLTNQLTTLSTANNIHLIKTLVKAKNFNKTTQPFRIDYLPTTRGRKVEVEWKLFHPASYLTDITDQAMTKKYQSTQKVDQQCTNPQAPDNNVTLSDFNNIEIGAFREFEIDAWQEILAAKTQPEGTPQQTTWSAYKAAPTQDVLDDYKKRYIVAIPVTDPLNELHRHHMLLNIAQSTELFKCLAARTKKADKDEVGHFITNASYVHKDLRTTIKELPKQVRHNYNLSIANAERSYLLNRIEQWQDKITELLQEETTQTAIINLLSNHAEPAKYAINLQVIANCLQRISKSPVAYDPMLTTISADATPGQAFIYKLANSPDNQLYQALWPKVDFQELTKDAPQSYPYKPNKGTGELSEHTLIAVGELDKLDPKLLNPIKAELFNIQIQTQYETNLELLRNELKAGYSGLYGLFSVLVTAVDEANTKRRELANMTKTLEAAQTDYTTAKTTADKSQSKVQKAKDIYNETIKTGETLAETQRQLEERIVFDKKRLAMLGVNEKALLEVVPTSFRGEAFLPFIKQLRMIPVFKDIGYILPSQASEKMIALGLYTKGNLDALEKLLTEFYGARATGDTLWAKFRNLVTHTGVDIRNLSTDLKDWVLGMKVSQIKKRRQVLAVFAHRLEQTFNHLIESIDVKNLQTGNLKQILNNQQILNALEVVAEQDVKAGAAAKTNLNQATTSLNDKQTQLRNVPNYTESADKYRTLLKSPMLPGALMMIEVWNVFSIYKGVEKVAIEKGEDRAVWGKRAALWDGGLAILLFIERLEIQKLQLLTKTFDHITWVRNIGLGKTNLLGIVNFAAMAITAGICFWDAAYYYKRNNPAWIGYAMAGTGASMLALQALLPALITPMGWFVVGVGLLVVGIGLATYLDNSDKLKEWFLQGPYRNNDNSSYQHLQESETALYHLLSLLLYFQVKVKKIDKAAMQTKWQQLTNPPITETADQKADREKQRALYHKAKQADLHVSVTCFCANFLTACQFIPALARYQATVSTSGMGPSLGSAIFKEKIPLSDLKEMIEYTEAGIELYLKVNKQYTNYGLSGGFSKDLWVFKMQVLAQPLDKTLGETPRVFPAPKLEYKEPYNKDIDSVAIFKPQAHGVLSLNTDTDQNFWFESAIEG